MKKLFLFAALIMTGFAFYSCEDVVDNPAQDPAQSWKYSVSVKFADFDFTAQPNDPVTGEPNAYVAPTTLYVLNEQNTLMGTITTDAAPAAGDYATYAGTITGSIGNNLIITTKIGNDLDKQDGTLASAIKNGIVQTAEVPIKVYNANSGKLTTAAAKMENKAAIVWVNIGSLNKGDEVKIESENFTTEDNAISFTLSDADTFNPNSAYVAIPADTKASDYTLSSETKNGRVLNATLEAKAFKAGEINTAVIAPSTLTQYAIPFKTISVDLTKFWAAYKEANPDATSNTFFTNKGTIITQSSSEYVPIAIYSIGTTEFTLKDINAKSLRVQSWGNKVTITLEGNNILNNEDSNYGLEAYPAELTLTGTGSLEATGKKYGIYIAGAWTDPEMQNHYSQFIVDKDVKITAKAITECGIYLSDNTTLDIKDGATLNATGIGDGSIGLKTEFATKVEIGAGATVIAKAGKNGEGINSGAEWDIKDGATIKGIGGKDGRGIDFWSNIKIGKNVTIEAQGAPVISEDALGIGMKLSNNTVTMDEGSTIIATGSDRGGLILWGATIDIKKGATIKAIDALDNALIIDGGTVTFTGKGTIEAKEAGKIGIAINNKGGYYGTLNLNGASVEAKGGAGKAAIQNNGTFVIGTDVISLKATAGTGAKCIDDGNGDEMKLEDLVADKDKFNDAIADGTRTITPKPAEK